MSETVTQVSDTEQKIVRSRTCGCRDFYKTHTERCESIRCRNSGQTGKSNQSKG